MKHYVMLVFLLLVVTVHAQAPEIAKGNEYFRNGQFGMAEQHYAAVVKSDAENEIARYNLGLALYHQQKFAEAEEIWKGLSNTSTVPGRKSSSFYNTGVIRSNQKRLEESIDSYKSALRVDPNDKQAR